MVPRQTDQEIADQCGITRPTLAKCMAVDPTVKLYTLAAVANAVGLVLELSFTDAPWANRRDEAVAVNGPAVVPLQQQLTAAPSGGGPNFERTAAQKANEDFLWRAHLLNTRRGNARRYGG